VAGSITPDGRHGGNGSMSSSGRIEALARACGSLLAACALFTTPLTADRASAQAVAEPAQPAVLRQPAAASPAPLRAVGADALVMRGGFVGFATGDDHDCPTGAGIVAGVEQRTPGRWFAGVAGDLYIAAPTVCGTASTVVPHESGTADEFAGITLLFAPRFSTRAGMHVDFWDLRFEPSVAAGALYAPELWGDAARRLVPWSGGALEVRPRSGRFGVVIEHGYHRVPVTHQVRTSGDWRVVREFGRWSPVTNLALTVRR
jgi:hypothetical protein